MSYDPPAVLKVSEVGEPLIGKVIGSGPPPTNPQWNYDESES